MGDERDRCSGTVARVDQITRARIRTGRYTYLRSGIENVIKLARLSEGLVVSVAVDVHMRVTLIMIEVWCSRQMMTTRVVSGNCYTGNQALVPVHSSLTMTFPGFAPDVAVNVLVRLVGVRKVQLI